jgi:Helix-turn-helix domain
VSFPIIAAIFAEWEMLQGRQVGPTARFVFLALANRMNKASGRCDPSYEALAQDTGFSRSAVSSALDGLWHAGLIDWTVRKKIGSKENDRNLYVIPNKPDPKDPKKKVKLQPAEPRPLSEKELELVTAKALRRAQAKSGNRTVNKSDESPVAGIGRVATGIPIPATGKGRVAERLEPGTQPGKKLDENGNVVGGGGAPTIEGDGSPFHFSVDVDGEGHQGIDLSGDPDNDMGTRGTESSEVDGDPGEQQEGNTEPAEMSGEHHGHNQDQPDYVDGDGVLSGEYETCPHEQEGETETAAPESRTAAPAAHAPQPRAKGSPLNEATELARLYYVMLGSPPDLKGRGPAWVKEAAALLLTYPLTDITLAATYAINHHFWRPKMLRFGPTDPFTYFGSKLPELREQMATDERAAALKPDHKASEPHHGKKPTTRKSKQQLVDEANQAGADKILRELRGLP